QELEHTETARAGNSWRKRPSSRRHRSCCTWIISSNIGLLGLGISESTRLILIQNHIHVYQQNDVQPAFVNNCLANLVVRSDAEKSSRSISALAASSELSGRSTSVAPKNSVRILP